MCFGYACRIYLDLIRELYHYCNLSPELLLRHAGGYIGHIIQVKLFLFLLGNACHFCIL